MQTVASTFVYRHTRVRITSERRTDFIDITDGVQELVAESGLLSGFANIQSLHTTVAVVVNEHEPLLLEDFGVTLDAIAPVDLPYRHDDPVERTANLTPDERRNGHSHCRALLLPSSASLNIVNGQLMLGRWQRVFLVDLDGPRPRDLSVMLMGEGGR